MPTVHHHPHIYTYAGIGVHIRKRRERERKKKKRRRKKHTRSHSCTHFASQVAIIYFHTICLFKILCVMRSMCGSFTQMCVRVSHFVGILIFLFSRPTVKYFTPTAFYEEEVWKQRSMRVCRKGKAPRETKTKWKRKEKRVHNIMQKIRLSYTHSFRMKWHAHAHSVYSWHI